jgi:hypothetical protein
MQQWLLESAAANLKDSYTLAYLDVVKLLQHGFDLLCIHQVVPPTQQHDTAWGQVLGPQVEVSPEEVAGEGSTDMQLMTGHVDAALLEVVHDAAARCTTTSVSVYKVSSL